MLRCPKACVVCQTWIFFKTPLCRLCRKYLYKEFYKNIDFISDLGEENEEVLCLSLWLWDIDNQWPIQQIIVAMKDGANPKIYHLFARWMRKKIEHHELEINQSLVPIPSSRKHPQQLLKVFAKEFKASGKDLLKKTKTKVQKYLSKTQRNKVGFEFRPETKNLHKNQKKAQDTKLVVLLDDVLVTGSSARQAICVLKPLQVEYIMVWAERL